jgi:hypothetical protein
LAAGLNRIRGADIQLDFQLWMPQVMLTIPGSNFQEDLQLSIKMWLPVIVFDEIEIYTNVKLRPIVEMIGIKRRPLVKDSGNPLMVFYPIDKDRGHNIPMYFDEYIQKLGGVDVIGNPISEVYSIGGGIFRQCFENICLDFDPNAPDGEQLNLAALGRTYKTQFFDDEESSIQMHSQDDIQMQVWESNTYVSSGEAQEIHIIITEKGEPVPVLEPLITITLPDNSHIEYRFPPTDIDGWASVMIPPIPAPMGTLIAYEVCLPETEDDSMCVSDNYLIWDIQ